MKTIEILQVCISPSWGGLEMVALETAVMMKSKGIVCRNVVAINSPLAQKIKNAGLPILEIHSGPLHFIQNIFTIRRLIQSHRISNIFVQLLRDLFLIRLSLIGFPQIRMVGFSHTFINVVKTDLYHSWSYKRLDSLIALTPKHKKNLLKYLPLREDNIKIIPNSVDTSIFNKSKRFQATRQSLDPSDPSNENILIGLVGRLDKAKGQSLLITAGAILKERGFSQFKILLIGEETLHEPGILKKLQKQVADLGLENHVLFTGFRSDIPEIMASLDIAVMASDAETFGRVIIEAMASGVAVIASNAGGVVDIIDDSVNGLLFTPRDEKDLASKIEKLMTNKPYRDQIANAAIDKVHKTYDQEIVQQKILALV